MEYPEHIYACGDVKAANVRPGTGLFIAHLDPLQICMHTLGMIGMHAGPAQTSGPPAQASKTGRLGVFPICPDRFERRSKC
jgi:hypothetical protein